MRKEQIRNNLCLTSPYLSKGRRTPFLTSEELAEIVNLKNFYGFTLLEMLVVLVIVSLISTVLLEGFSYVLHLRSGFLVQLENGQKGVIQEHWFRSSIAGIVTDYQEGEDIFKGKERELSGLTLAALDSIAGAPTSFAWQLQYTDGTTRLNYQNSQGEIWEVAHWFGDEGYFQYRAVNGDWHNQWPPQLGLKTAQIPRLIVLHGKRRQTPFAWIVKLAEDDQTRIDYRLYE